MPTLRPPANVSRYLLTVFAVTAAVIGVRFLITWAAEIFLHPIPILGGWLKSLEIIELSVVLLFAVLGFGLGSATRHLSAKTSLGIKSIALLVALPLVFFSSYWLRHHLWLSYLTTESTLSRQQITALANQALSREGGSQGFWGYYTTTTRMPILPATVDELERMAEDQKWFRSELTRFSGIEPGVFSMIFDGAGWGIRLFYMGLAFLTGVIYFFKGLAEADAARLRKLAQGTVVRGKA
ncbi:hypothetical protein IQ273_15160 [Nodosilinea sp. LEGE 07298]|uniref:hypothetical protein n=1 Tax=Nodosilinea sp. LEGE 07298 TaxID=2777970 RepID=UPI00187E4BB5|nr:hypothetical protein [Nodosilinea sp. LEGE 07298]MBE9110753.1 hypothetical protein [Nodosilinea sp. LEGE 07298]